MYVGDGDAIHLWFGDLDDPGVRAACDLCCLNTAERQCMRCFSTSCTTARFAVERCLTRCVVGRYLGRAPEVVPMGGTMAHWPLADGAAMCVSAARSDRWLVLAIAGFTALGCEIDRREGDGGWQERLPVTASPVERRWLRRLSRRRRRECFADLSVRKRAWANALGRDASERMSAVSVFDSYGVSIEFLRDSTGIEWCCQSVPSPMPDTYLAVSYPRPAEQGRPAMVTRWMDNVLTAPVPGAITPVASVKTFEDIEWRIGGS